MYVADQADVDLAAILGVSPEMFGPRAVAFRQSRARAATALMLGVIVVGLAIPTALNRGLIDATGRPRPGSSDASLMVLQPAPPVVHATPSALPAPAVTAGGGEVAAEVEPLAATAKPRQRLASTTRRRRPPRLVEVEAAPVASLSPPALPAGDEAMKRVLAAERLEAVDAMRLLRQH